MNFPIDKTDEWEERQDAHKQPGAVPVQHSVTTMQGLRDELVIAQQRIAAFTAERDALQKGYTEVMDERLTLRKERAEARAQVAALTKPVSQEEGEDEHR